MMKTKYTNNMWPFSYFKRKKEEKLLKQQQEEANRIEKIKKEKEKYNIRREYVIGVVKELENIEYKKKEEYRKKQNESFLLYNSICPICGSKNIIHNFKRHKGDLKGSLDVDSNMSSHSSFFSSHSYHSTKIDGDIDGKLDTLKVNVCKSCLNEWEHKNNIGYISCNEYYQGKIDYSHDVETFIRQLYYSIEDIENFNLEDITETCLTREEKTEVCFSNIEKSYYFKNIKDLSLEVIYYYASTCGISISHLLKKMTIEGSKPYNGLFLPKYEKYLIEYFGFKKHFND